MRANNIIAVKPNDLVMWRTVLVFICLLGLLVNARQIATRKQAVPFLHHHLFKWSSDQEGPFFDLERWRGGETEQLSPTTKKKKKTGGTKKKKKMKQSSMEPATTATKSLKAAVRDALQDTDAADALGQAIRNHADELRNDETKMINDDYSTMRSLGWAMGAADHDLIGGIQVAPASVMANYFLKSHGGAHGLQSICSILAAATGFAAILVPQTKIATRLALIKRCLIFAMVKHVSGLLAGSFVAAQSIPLTGYRRAVEWMKDLANDPVSQYVFYTAIMLLWLPSTKSSSTIPLDYWWKLYQAVPIIILAPILLREVMSTVFVISDILLLQATLAKKDESPDNKLLRNLLIASSTMVNAAMSLLVTSARWNTSVIERQEILAKLVSRLSIVFELVTGLILAADVAFTVAGGGFMKMAKQALCLRLYLQFLWIRRKKIERLAREIRGGAGVVPFYILDVLMDPRGAMGLKKQGSSQKEDGRLSWKDYAAAAFDLD